MEKQISKTGRAIVVEEGANPSTDFFVLPALRAAGFQVERRCFKDLLPPQELEAAVVVFVRYVPPAWARLVAASRQRLGGLIFFMDDDVLDPGASAEMPLRYRWKLARLAAWRKGWLRQQKAKLWVSTPYLQRKYTDWHPQLVLPLPLNHSSNIIRFFYHGSASHGAEIRWLRPIIEDVLQKDEKFFFEIVGDSEVRRLYRGLSRVTVVHPMKWPAYSAFLTVPGRHVGLAPLLDLPFNQARSYTKFFDITRCGAVGIYPPNSAFSEVIKHGENGLVVELGQEQWVEAILWLGHNEELCKMMLRNAENDLVELSDRASNLYSELTF